jgi:hypothetical protein
MTTPTANFHAAGLWNITRINSHIFQQTAPLIAQLAERWTVTVQPSLRDTTFSDPQVAGSNPARGNFFSFIYLGAHFVYSQLGVELPFWKPLHLPLERSFWRSATIALVEILAKRVAENQAELYKLRTHR